MGTRQDKFFILELADRGALPREDEDLLREHQAMHEENFLSSWLREDVEGKEGENTEMDSELSRRFQKTRSECGFGV